MADNQDIAVLGFTVQTKNAETALDNILGTLKTIDDKITESDALLEDKVTKAMTEMASAVKAMNSAANSFAKNKEGVQTVVDAFSHLSDIVKGMDTMQVSAKAFKESLVAMNDAGIDNLSKKLSKSMKLLEDGSNVIELTAKVVNPEVIQNLSRNIEVTFDGPTVTAFFDFTQTLENMKTLKVSIPVPTEDIGKINEEIKNKINTVLTPTISFKYKAKDAVRDLYDALHGALEDKPFEVPIAFTIGNDKILAQNAAKAAADPIEEFRQKVLDDLKADKWGGKVVKKNGDEWFNNIFQGALRENFELSNDFDQLLEKIYKDQDAIAEAAAKMEDIRQTFLEGEGQNQEPKNLMSADALNKIVQEFKTNVAPAASEIQKLLTFSPTVVMPKEISVDASQTAANVIGGRMNVNANEVLVHPKKIVVDAAFVNPDNVSLINGNTLAEALQQEPLKITTKIKLDPLPSDEIDKLDKLVTRLHDVEGAYSNIQTVAARLKDTVKELDSSMSAEVKALIKSGVSDVGKIARENARQQKRDEQAAQILKMVSDLDQSTNWKPVSDARSARTMENVQQQQKQAMDLVKEGGAIWQQQQNDIDAVTRHFQYYEKTVDQAANTFINDARREAEAMRVSSQMMRQRLMAVADANTAFKLQGVTLRDVNMQMRDFGRIEKLNIEDPLKRLKADLGETNSRLIDLGRTFGLYLSGRSIINYFRQASESANTFQYEIRRIQSLATNFDFGELRNGLMDIDARFGNVVHNASALYWAFSSGVRGSEKDLVKFTETMSKTATTIKADVMPTLDAATSIMNAWNLNASSAAEIGDLLFGIVKYGKSNAQQLTTSLGHVVAPAAALNIELDELGAAAATLTKTMKTNRAFTYLSNILGKMASPTKAVQEAAAELGIELSASSIKARGFANTLADIRQATGGDIAKIAKIFPDLRGQRAAITLLSTQYKDFEQQLVNMRNKAGSMEEALSKIADTPEAQLRALKNTFSMLSIEAGHTVNSMLTLGGALGPALKSINELGHTGRATLGNVIATGAAWAGMAVTMKAVQASQYAIAQMAYQQSSAAADLYKTELDTSLLKERQALENNKIALSEMKAKIAADEYNDATLRTLKAKQDQLKISLREGDVELRNARQALKIMNEADRNRFMTDSASLAESQGRLVQLRNLRTREQTGAFAQKYSDDLNIAQRLKNDIAQITATLKEAEADFLKTNAAQIRGLVENSEEAQTMLRDAMEKGSLKEYQTYDSLYSKIVQVIKADRVVSSALSGYDNAEAMAELYARQYTYAKLQANLTSGANDQHRRRLEYLDAEIKKETERYNTAKAAYDATRNQLGLDAERQRLADEMLQIDTNLNSLKTEQADLVTQIEQRTEILTGREKEQAAILAENIKNMKAWLDADTTDSQTLKSNLELSLKNAATLGKDTLAATREAYEAEMRRNSIIMQQRAVMSEILSITDKNGNLLDKSEKSQERLNKLLAEQAKLMKDSADARRQFITLGAHAGNQDAVKTIIDQYQRNSKAGFLNPSLQKKYLGVVVDRLKLDSGVQSEMIRAMVREMGGRGMAGFFSGNAMRSMTMAMSFMPGMQRWAMPLNLMSSLNVIGQAQKGFAGLSSSMTRMLVSAENLKKKGFMALDKNMVDLTKTFIENVAWTKKQAFANKALMAMSTGSVAGKNAIAWAAVTSTWLTAGLGGAIIAAVAGGLYLAFSKTEKGGPFGEIAEKLYGVEDKQRYGEYLNLRIEMMNTEKTANDDMIREMKRMIAATSNIQDSLLNIAERNRMIEAMQGIERYGNVSQTKLDIVEVQHQIENDQKRLEALRNSVSRGSLHGELVYKGSYDEKRIQQLQQEIEQATKDLQEKQKIVKEYPKFLASLAEADYQLLRETMEADRDSAFMPMKDAQARFQLAEKQVKLSLNRLASILGPKGGIADLANATTADVQEMARTVIKDLYKKMKQAEDNLNAAKLKLELAKQQKQNTTELEKKVTDLEKQAADATKAYENTRQNIQTGARDLYANLVNRAEMYVKSQLDLVKRRESNAKYLALFENVDTSFRTQAENITIMRQTMDKLQKDFASGSGIFKGLSPKDRDDTYRDKVLEVSEATKTMISNRANAIKTMADQMNTFMNSLASDMESQAKSLFDFKINNPLYAELRPTLIKNRMGFLNQLLYGKGGVLSMRANALQEMQRLQGLGDLGGAQKMMMEVQKWQKKGVDIEQQRLDLIKLEADKEKEINASLYQLANTLRGQFQATSQQAIDADSAEAIRLRSRAFNENIAPAVSTDANRLLAKEWERMAARNEEWSNELKKSVDSLTEALIKEADDKAINGAAVNIKTAGDNIKAAAGIFQKAAEQTKTMIVVKRI